MQGGYEKKKAFFFSTWGKAMEWDTMPYEGFAKENV